MMTEQIPSNLRDSLLRKLQLLPERELTRRILINLFKLEYDKVDPYGGPYEGGKDLICWRKTKLGETETAVVQVKKVRLGAAASKRDNFSELVTQLQQALEKPVHSLEGPDRKPDKIIFVTPFPVSTRALETRIEKYRDLAQFGIRVIDGPKLVELIFAHFPQAIDDLLGKDKRIQQFLTKHLSNQELLSALSVQDFKDISTFYCDLNFGIGKINTAMFFQLRPTSLQESRIKLSKNDWEQVQKCSSIAEDLLGILILKEHPSTVGSTFSSKYKEFIEQARTHLEHLKTDLEPVISVLSKHGQKLAGKETKDKPSRERLITLYKNVVARLSGIPRAVLAEGGLIERDLVFELSQLSAIRRQIDGYEERLELDSAFTESETVERAIGLVAACDKAAFSDDSTPKYEVTLQSGIIAETIQSKQAWLYSTVKEFNLNAPKGEDLRRFLLDCQKVFEVIKIFAQNPILRSVIGFEENQRFVMQQSLPGFTISIHDVFDTGLNLSVLGEAGSGKTTSLQVYAKKALARKGNEKMVLFIPLARCVAPAQDGQHEVDGSRNLISLIANYLTGLGIAITEDELTGFFRSRRASLLLDGLDEVVHSASSLLPTIRDFTAAHPDLQVIVSSRTVGDLLESLPFLGMTLLPFTDEQRERFVSSWFGVRQSEKADTVMRHLCRHADLFEIVRNPLLATILCVLADHDVPLPDSEIRLYEERMRLLLGQYKGVRRLRSPFPVLLRLSQKIALELHRTNKRYASLKTLHNFAQQKLAAKEGEEAVRRAVGELIDPCNVLLPMTERGSYGFGHLRYQEYLAARELHENRSIKLVPLLHSSWWKSVMVLFAEMCDDLKFLMNVLADMGPEVLENETVRAMFAVRPEDERAALTQIVKLRHKLENNSAILERERYDFKRRKDEENYNDYEPLRQYVEEYREVIEDEPKSD